jgi:pimeloyl-ACP methyl ester carboxylesterase
MTVQSPFADQLKDIPVHKREVTVLGSVTRYWVYGDPHASTTVVVAHGYRGEHHGLEPVIAQMPALRFISPDLPGFGESTPMIGTAHDINGYAAWLTAFVAAVDAGDAIVLGHSFGTIVSAAALVAGLSPRALVLVNPIAISGLKGPHRIATSVTVAYYRLAALLPEALGYALLKNWLIVQFMSSSLAKTRDRKRRRWIHAEHHTYFNRFANRDVVVEAFLASISTDVSAFAAKISVPTLLVAAQLDDITPIAAQYALQGMFPHATLRVLPDVGHLVHYEVPAQAAEAISEFISALAQK